MSKTLQDKTLGTLTSVNPYNGEVLKTYAEMTPAAVEAAIEAADTAFRVWREQSFEDRATILRRVAALFRERREALARIMTLEMGKKIEDSRPEIDLCARIFEY
ncbi:MAG: aldehyde dehydrogenase family protein, partial [Phycisphaerae bacterium]